jgi:hypothetical protein
MWRESKTDNLNVKTLVVASIIKIQLQRATRLRTPSRRPTPRYQIDDNHLYDEGHFVSLSLARSLTALKEAPLKTTRENEKCAEMI